MSAQPDENTLVLTQPDDMHLHLRDGEMMRVVAPMSARWAGRAIVMPNLRPPITTTAMAVAYRQRIVDAVPGSSFRPLMTLYLTDHTCPDEIRAAKASGAVFACKLYPAGATTNSDSGVTDILALLPVFRTMEELSIVLCIHGEVVDPSVDFFEREQCFLADKLSALLAQIPNLKVVLEHATTKEAVDFVMASDHPGGIGCTITPQHLLFNRNALFIKGLNPHFFCLPILKREEDRSALLAAATSGNPRFFAGTDSAPHIESNKLSACGCAGCFTANAAVEMYAEAFDSVGCMDKLEGFLSMNGAKFYGLPLNTNTITLKKTPFTIPAGFEISTEAGESQTLVPLLAGQDLTWTLV